MTAKRGKQSNGRPYQATASMSKQAKDGSEKVARQVICKQAQAILTCGIVTVTASVVSAMMAATAKSSPLEAPAKKIKSRYRPWDPDQRKWHSI